MLYNLLTGDPFENFDLAIAYPPDVPEDLAANVSASLLRLQVGCVSR